MTSGVGAVDDEWRIDAHLQRLDDGLHLLHLIAAFGHRDTQVECVRAAFHLRPCDTEDAVVVVRKQQALDRARSLGIDALADEQRRGLLVEVDGVHRTGETVARHPA